MGARDPSVDRLRAARELRRASSSSSGATISGTGTTSPGWARLCACLRNEEEGVPEVGRFNAGQKFVFWSMALLVPALFLTGLVIWEAYFGEATSIETQRAAALIHSYAAIAAIIIWITHVYAAIWVRGSMRGMTQGYVTPGWAWRHHRKWLRSLVRQARSGRGRGRERAPPSPTPLPKGRAEGRPSCRTAMGRPDEARSPAGSPPMRQGETAPKGGWIGNASGGVKAPEPIVLADPGRRFSRTAERLEQLVDGHAAEGWLAFMAEVSRAQRRAAANLVAPRARPTEPPSLRRLRRAFRPSRPTGIAATRLGAMVLQRCSMLRRDDVSVFHGRSDRGASPPRRHGDGEPRRRFPARRRRSGRRRRGFLDRRGVAGLFRPARRQPCLPQTLRLLERRELLPLLRLDLVGQRDHRLGPKSGRALSLLLALLDRLEPHPRRLHWLRRLPHPRATRP